MDESRSEDLAARLMPLAEDAVDLAEQVRVFRMLFPTAAAERVNVGRFELLRRLGRGGMGEVHVAYDAQLDRKVALKLLLRERSDDEQARDRLLREAQVLARLSHPNVVQIHEAGIHEGQVFLAMELVEGITLREWLEQRPEGAAARPWTEVLPVMIEAGRGLAAAHAATLTHRDFKPDNVLVGDDGRVRVLDFGLARPGAVADDGTVETTADYDTAGAAAHSLDEPTASLSGARAARSLGSGRGMVQLTEPGRVVGTLAYMPPEQLAAMPVDARTDQYSFCVTLYEALYGERPFHGRTFAAHMIEVTQGLMEEPASRSAVPRWLRALVRRGLSASPEDRFADMDTLLRELSRPRGRRWKTGLVAGALVLGGVGTSWALSPAEVQPCELDQTALAGTWDPARREALRAVFAIPGYSAESAALVERSISDWSDRWLASLRSACEATRRAGTQSEAMLDRRSGCLERQRREANAIVELLADPERPQIGHAFELLEQLPDSAVCDDPRLAETPHPLPTQPERRTAILAAYEQLGRARALTHSAHLDEADELAERLEATATTLDYLPLTLEVRSFAAVRSFRRKRFPEAVPVLRAVIRESEIAGLDELSATASTQLAVEIVGQWGRPAVQGILLEHAETAVARLGRSSDRRASQLDLARARWVEVNGDYEGALAGYRASIERALDHEAHAQAGLATLRMAHFLVQLGRFEAAKLAYANSRASYEDAQGPNTLVDANIELHMGLLELARGSFEAAEAHFEASRALYAPLVGPDSTSLNLLELAEAKLAFMRGDLERAGQGFARVIDAGVDDLRRAEAWEALGVIRFYQGDMPGSLDAYRRARTYRLATLGSEHPSFGILQSNIGETLAALGDHQGALAAFSDALASLERTLPPDHADLALPYKGRAQSLLALGDAAAARIDLERALVLHEANPGEPVERADVERTLARVLLALGEPVRGLELAEHARQHLVEVGHDEAAAEISTWIEERSRAEARTNDRSRTERPEEYHDDKRPKQ